MAFALPLRTVGSPSSRREWIEIQENSMDCAAMKVALLTEGVDRNTFKIEEG